MPQRKTNKRVQKKIAPPTRTNGWITYKGTRHTLYKKADGKLVVKVFNKESNKYSYVAAPSKKGGVGPTYDPIFGHLNNVTYANGNGPPSPSSSPVQTPRSSPSNLQSDYFPGSQTLLAHVNFPDAPQNHERFDPKQQYKA